MNRGWVCINLLLLAFGLASARAQEVQWIRAAFWDARYPGAGWSGSGDATRDALQAAGYEILNADQLKTWMLARIADKKYSVVVFCRDTAPDTVTESRSPTCTVRRYLDAGGKIVWYADIPFYYQGYADGTRTSTNWGNAGATDILGFATASAPRDSNQTVTLTALGLKWGLTKTWQSQRPAFPTITPDLKILATDDSGNAAAWVKPFVKGDTFRGFVRFFDRSGQPDVGDIMRVAEYIDVRASNPQPANGAAGVSLALLRWDASSLAVSHNVYLGTTPGLTGVSPVPSIQAYYYHAAGFEPGATYYWRVDEVDADGTVWTGDLWSFTATPPTAWAPQPGDGFTYVDPCTALQWSAGFNAVGHDVYLGTDRAAVESGAGDTLKASGLLRPTYTPGPLARATTYYWRVDETVGSSKVTGPVWSFAVRPVMAKADPSLIGWWKLDDEGSGTAVDYSGWDHYGTLYGPQWTEGYFGDGLEFDGLDDYVDCGTDASIALSGSFTLAAWIRLNASTSDAKIASNQNNATGGYKMGVYSNKVELEIRTAANSPLLNRPIEGGTILTPGLWYHVAGVYSQGQYLRTYVNGVLDRERLLTDLLGTSNGTLKIGRESHTSGFYWFGSLDDVRLYNRALTQEEVQQIVRGDPRLASDRQPARDAVVDFRDATALSWSPGETAAAHDVYFGTDKAAVKAAGTTSPEYQGRQDETSFSLDGLVTFGGTYFWRIDEVEADGTTLYPGDVWGFTIPDYLLVDDFESYNDLEDQGTRIYETWLDGLTNGTTSVVGNWDPPFCEQTIVHGGKQSMPMDYNNIIEPYRAEGEREFAPVQDWTTADVNTLSLWYRGLPPAFLEAADGLITMGGSGHDIWDNADDFRFAWKRLSGNGSILVKVESIGNTNAWAKGGVMIRQSLDADSKFAYMIVSAAQGVSFGWRDLTAGTCTSRTQAGVPAPQWVKLTRTGDAFTAQYSADGKTWSDIKNADGTVTSTTVTMTGSIYVGLCVTSHNTAATTSAGFTSPSTTASATGEWQVTAIGDDPEPANAPDSLYLMLEDSGGKRKVIPNPDPGAVLTTTWTEWKIPLSDFNGVTLSRVKKLYLGVGDRQNPQATGSGRIYIDDIRLVK
jgi:hypothetical protein